MADSEFEVFRLNLESLPRHFGTHTPFYSIVPDVGLEEETPSTKSDISDLSETQGAIEYSPLSVSTVDQQNDDQIEQSGCILPWTGERRRRRLPDIPKQNKSGSPLLQTSCAGVSSLAEELGTRSGWASGPAHPVLMLKCGYLLDEDSSPDSERPHSLGDGDSGHSTSHSPTEGPKSLSPLFGSPLGYLQTLEATHRGLHKFVPRHSDEIDVEIGDALYVQREADDLWCEGVNLRTGRRGVFPSAYAVDVDYSDFDPASIQSKRERYLLGYMGSVETVAHKGTSVVCQAVRKIIGDSDLEPPAQPCILEVSDQGLRMVDRSKRSHKCSGPCIDYFYSLKNVSFCAFHPRDHRYLGFITKHPALQRFACHVFRGRESTRPVAEAVGRAFQKFYQKFIETAYPIEDIYIE